MSLPASGGTAMSVQKSLQPMATIQRILLCAGLLLLHAPLSRADSWISAPPMPSARTGLAVVAGRDGRIFAIAGNGRGSNRIVEAYDPVSQNWSAVAPIPTGRFDLAAATDLDGRIFALGGLALVPLPTVEFYYPFDDTWT